MTIELKYPKGKNGKVVCQECGEAFRLITPKHLSSKHSMTFAEYKLKYPDCPISGTEYEASRFKFKDSILFKDDEGLPTEELDPDIDIDRKQLDRGIKFSVLDLEGVSKNKVDILEFLHKAYPYLENNYCIEKRHFYDESLLWKYITDMADPINKVIFDFPNAFWHNEDPFPDPQKFIKLKEDGWLIIECDKHYPTAQDVSNDTDVISD